jgi:hypothetical protein
LVAKGTKLPRPSLSTILSNVANAARVIQANGSQIIAGATKVWLEEHREELIATIIEARTERGAAMLHEFCIQFPALAGLVTLAMKGSPEMAIAAIAFYDPKVAETMQKHRGNLEKLQDYWRRGAEQQQEVK